MNYIPIEHQSPFARSNLCHYNRFMLNMDTSWTTVIGHEWVVDALSGALANDRLSHAYLLTGPAHIGKTVLARTFAQALNCETESPSPCMVCRACRLIAQDGHPDVRLIRPEASSSGRTETLRIEQVRNLQKELSLSPYEGLYRVAILTRFEQASIGAANALLKTLEEPPGHVVLVLTAESPDLLLPTIVSRCQLFPLRPLPLEKVEAALLFQWEASESQAFQLAHFSGGRLGLAVRLLKEPKYLERRAQQLDQLEELLGQDRTARFAFAEKLSRQKSNQPIVETLDLWLHWWRDVMLLAGAQAGMLPVINIDRMDRLQIAAQRYDLSISGAAVRAIQQTRWQLEHNANTRLALEVLMLSLPQA